MVNGREESDTGDEKHVEEKEQRLQKNESSGVISKHEREKKRQRTGEIYI